MLNPVPKSVHFMDYLHFGALFDLLLSVNLLELVQLSIGHKLVNIDWQNSYKSKIFWWSNYGTTGVEH